MIGCAGVQDRTPAFPAERATRQTPMTGSSETAQPPNRRTFFDSDEMRDRMQPAARVERELLGTSSGVDARTSELRQRIAAASRLNLIGSLLLIRR
jgi:hypothetical protein